VWSAAVLLLLGAALAAPLARHRLSPDRPLQEHRQRLANGKEITLVGPGGPPRWLRSVVGDPAVVPRADDPAFCLRMLGTIGLLELLPDVPCPSYRFQAEVRHDSAATPGDVGVYFAHATERTERGNVECLCALTFNDREAHHKSPQGQLGSLVRLRAYRVGPGAASVQGAPNLQKHFLPAVRGQPGHKPWHQLALEVTPDQVEAFWDGRSLGTVTRQAVHRSYRHLNLPAFPRSYCPDLRPAFSPSGGRGLLLANDTASFRSVGVVPRP
jgi:hypothetical protein